MGKHFYYGFHHRLVRYRELLILLGFTLGAVFACLFVKTISVKNLQQICVQLTQESPRLGVMALCSVLPVLLAAGFSALRLTPWNWILPSVGSGFLFSFLTCAFLEAMGKRGIVLTAALLSGRAISLCCLFWFLLRRTSSKDEQILPDLICTGAISMLSAFVYFWLFSPAIRELGQRILY